MGTLVGNPQQEVVPGEIGLNRERLSNFGAYLRRNPALIVRFERAFQLSCM